MKNNNRNKPAGNRVLQLSVRGVDVSIFKQEFFGVVVYIVAPLYQGEYASSDHHIRSRTYAQAAEAANKMLDEYVAMAKARERTPDIKVRYKNQEKLAYFYRYAF